MGIGMPISHNSMERMTQCLLIARPGATMVRARNGSEKAWVSRRREQLHPRPGARAGRASPRGA